MFNTVACSNEVSATSVPSWLIEQWSLIETEEKGVYQSEINEWTLTNLIFEHSDFEGIPVLRTFNQTDFENRRNYPELFPLPVISQEQAIQITIDHMKSNELYKFTLDSNLVIEVFLNDNGWYVRHLNQNDESVNSYLINKNSGEIIRDDFNFD